MRSEWTTFLTVCVRHRLGICRPRRCGSRRASTHCINGHVQPTRAVKVDTLLTEEKARAKLINEAKLKFGIIDEIDVSGVRLYLNKGMQFDIGQGVGCQTWHVAQHGPWWQTGSVVSRCGPYPPSDPPFFRPSWAVLAVGQRVPSA